jgi:hypothetical protein
LADPIFRFAFDMTFADYLALSRARERLGPLRGWGRVLRYPVWLGLFFGAMWWQGALRAPLHVYLEWDVVKWVLAIPVMILAIDLFFRHVVYRWHFSRHAIAGKPAVVEIDGEEVRWTIGPVTGAAPLSRVTASLVTETHAFLFLSRVEGITLPRRGLEKGDWAAFLDLLTRKTALRPPSA